MRDAGARSPQRVGLSYYLVTVAVAEDEREIRSAELWDLGAVGVEELPGAVRAAFPTKADAEAAAAITPGANAPEVYADQVGLDESRDLLKVERGGRFAVHPPWLPPPADAVAIEIDPGHAFGSGSHATTRLALELIDQTVRAGQRVFDVGCGTGVLSIAAARIGAIVVAVDIDPAAVEATTENARRNGVDGLLSVHEGSADSEPGPFDIAIVNVTIDLHEAIAPLRASWPPKVIVSGVLDGSQLDRAAMAYDRAVVQQLDEGDWVAAVIG